MTANPSFSATLKVIGTGGFFLMMAVGFLTVLQSIGDESAAQGRIGLLLLVVGTFGAGFAASYLLFVVVSVRFSQSRGSWPLTAQSRNVIAPEPSPAQETQDRPSS